MSRSLVSVSLVNGAFLVEIPVKVLDWDSSWVHDIDSLLMDGEKALNKPLVHSTCHFNVGLLNAS